MYNNKHAKGFFLTSFGSLPESPQQLVLVWDEARNSTQGSHIGRRVHVPQSSLDAPNGGPEQEACNREPSQDLNLAL